MPQTPCHSPPARQGYGAHSPADGGLLAAYLLKPIRAIADCHPGPFYVYDQAILRSRCGAFTSIPYDNKGIHFASMANTSPQLLRIVRQEGLGIFVNSTDHLELAQALGFHDHDIVYTASAMDETQMRRVHKAGALINLDSLGQLETYGRLFPEDRVGIRCNIGELIDPRPTRAGYFLGTESRLGLTVAEIEGLAGSRQIVGLHLYVGTDLLDLTYFEECYEGLVRLTRLFPDLGYIDFGGGFGLPREEGRAFPFRRYGGYVAALMVRLSRDLDRSIRLLLEPGRVIGGEAGHFVCRVTDVKWRHASQLIGVNGSSAQFPRPLFYPDDVHHPVTVLAEDGRRLTPPIPSAIYGCSTYSRDFLARDVALPQVTVGDLVILGHAGSYCASAHTHFLGFPAPDEFFV